MKWVSLLKRFWLSALLAAVVMTGAGVPQAMAAALEIGPTRIQMVGQERTATLTLRNTSEVTTNIQVRTFDWSQSEGRDALTASQTLVASPGLITLAPGESQVVRMVANPAANADSDETAFRLVLDELPSNNPEEEAGLRQVVRILVPVFITRSGTARPAMEWSATQQGDTLTLSARNTGTTRERLVNITLANGAAAIDWPPLEGYVLSGAERQWQIRVGDAPVNTLHLKGDGDFGAVSANVPVTLVP